MKWLKKDGKKGLFGVHVGGAWALAARPAACTTALSGDDVVDPQYHAGDLYA
jgi:hypothetical protein